MSVDRDCHHRTPNRAQLREVASLLATEVWIERVSVFPANRPESIVVFLVDRHYPQKFVSEAYIEVQSYTNGDFHVVYVEDHHGTKWTCRWDRHESDDYARDHFHAPPGARHEDGEDRDYPVELASVLSRTVAPWVYERMGAVWDEFDL
ncbi:hypothetical protein [Halegenticoccus tardaugens]|uniref:hypothetical protein n=1 Tax=Halegenticoccus tardaugens TaxID=2071624 RepID=UPI00100B529B|nr:hypothetical protein [Halegenticoccus tardaugens]